MTEKNGLVWFSNRSDSGGRFWQTVGGCNAALFHRTHGMSDRNRSKRACVWNGAGQTLHAIIRAAATTAAGYSQDVQSGATCVHGRRNKCLNGVPAILERVEGRRVCRNTLRPVRVSQSGCSLFAEGLSSSRLRLQRRRASRGLARRCIRNRYADRLRCAVNSRGL